MLSATSKETFPSSLPSEQLCYRFSIDEIREATKNFDEALVVGQGGFGKVFKGIVKINGASTLAAIKRLHSRSNQGESNFWGEIEMLSKLRHCNLASLLGYCNDGEEMILGYEYMPNGSLEDHLHKLGSSLSWLLRLKICLGAARGLDYLHTGTGAHHGVIHRDVKTANILLDETWTAKISDFGLSKIGPTNQTHTHVSTGVKGTFGYMDPDYFYTGKITRKADTYAFGVVLFEMLCGRRAVDTNLDEEQWSLARYAQDCVKEGKLDKIIDSSLRGQILPSCLKKYASIAGRCLERDPKQRPTMTEVVNRLQSCLSLQERTDSSATKGTLIEKVWSMFSAKAHFEGKREISDVVNTSYPGYGTIPKATEGGQVVDGWPSWLAAVAGEAIKGWLPRQADTFEKIDMIGQGTSSCVYKARDLISNKIVALKKVQFDNMDPESVKFVAREILILRRLDHPNVIKLEGLITSRMSCTLYLIFEYMEHDLTGLASLPGVKFTEAQVKCYMQQLLNGLEHCHSRGVLHRDIKGSNLLIDNHGILKIADFGLASFFDHHQSVPLTSRVVTLWYRPPELLLGATHYGVAVDLWSTGCILGELYAGKPIMPGRTEVEQLHKIFILCGSPSEDYWRKSKLPHSTIFKPQRPYRRRIEETFKDFPSAAIGLMETLLAIDPAQRGTTAFALKSEFFTTKPHGCDPSSLPKYPPSKEIDAKMRDEEARRQGVAGAKGQKIDRESRRSKEPRAVPAPNANAELVMSMQQHQRRQRGVIGGSSSSGFVAIQRRDPNFSSVDEFMDLR